MKTLGIHIREATKSNERAVSSIYKCSLENGECPLLKEGKCLHLCFLGSCIYGKLYNEQSCTKKSKSYRNELAKMKENAEKEAKLPVAAYNVGIQLIGDYYYLPYSFMTMCEKVPFIQHSCLFVTGVPFIKKELFTIETIVKLVKYNPQALMGETITQYQKEEVPKFLFDLKYRFPELYKTASELCPEIIEKTINLDNIEKITCSLNHIPLGSVDGYKVCCGKELLDVVLWNGKEIILSGKYKAISTLLIFGLYGNEEEEDFTLTFSPLPEKVMVSVTDKELMKEIAMKNPELVKIKE